MGSVVIVCFSLEDAMRKTSNTASNLHHAASICGGFANTEKGVKFVIGAL